MIHNFLDNLWNNYTKITPQASKIKLLLEKEGEVVLNDHIAFRTIDAGDISITYLQPHLFKLGYKVFDTYLFKEKKLIANAYIHPDPTLPKIFLSGIQPNYFSPEVENILLRLAESATLPWKTDLDIFYSGTLWPSITATEYVTLLKESEYAAWVATLGIRPNHFTVNVNALKKYNSVESVLGLVENYGFKINEFGGRVKGSKSILLEQGSTMADTVTIDLVGNDGNLVPAMVPSCYYEFALRHPDKNGNLYQGFVEKSADKIFESTDIK